MLYKTRTSSQFSATVLSTLPSCGCQKPSTSILVGGWVGEGWWGQHRTSLSSSLHSPLILSSLSSSSSQRVSPVYDVFLSSLCVFREGGLASHAEPQQAPETGGETGGCSQAVCWAGESLKPWTRHPENSSKNTQLDQQREKWRERGREGDWAGWRERGKEWMRSDLEKLFFSEP